MEFAGRVYGFRAKNKAGLNYGDRLWKNIFLFGDSNGIEDFIWELKKYLPSLRPAFAKASAGLFCRPAKL